MQRTDWREKFSLFAKELAARNVYVTVDLDCLGLGEAVTNWEMGLFSLGDIAWALAELRKHATMIGGDLCGAHSEPRYARRWQRLAAERDRPRQPAPDAAASRRLNARAFAAIWPALTARDHCHASADQQDADP
jgi:hypothetical protein